LVNHFWLKSAIITVFNYFLAETADANTAKAKLEFTITFIFNTLNLI